MYLLIGLAKEPKQIEKWGGTQQRGDTTPGERGGGGQPTTRAGTAVGCQVGGDTEQFRNVQEWERYGIHVSGTKSRYRTVLRTKISKMSAENTYLYHQLNTFLGMF